MRKTEDLLNKQFLFVRTGITYRIYSVREYENGNHKCYMENIDNTDEQVAEFILDLDNTNFWIQK